MPRDNNNNNDDDGTWRASGSGMASLIITINEAKNIKGTPGAQIGIRATISIPGNSKNKNANTTLSKQYSQRKQQDITLDHIFKIKPPLSAREGTVVDWRRTKGRLTIETVEIEEDIMNGGTKVTTIGDHTIILRELVDNDKRGGKQSNSIENKWIKLSNRNGGEILISVELELPKAGRGASALHRPKGESRAEKRAKSETSNFRSDYSSHAEGMKTSANDAKRTAKKQSPRSPRAKLKDKLNKAYEKFMDDRGEVSGKNVASLLRKVTPLGHPSAKALDISKWIRKNGLSLSDELSFYQFESLYNSIFPPKSGSGSSSNSSSSSRTSSTRPTSNRKGRRPISSRFSASARSAWKIGAKCIYKNKYVVKISRINADKTFNISYQEGRYKGKILEGVEKDDLELDDSDRLERSNKDVVLVGDNDRNKSSSNRRGGGGKKKNKTW